jgi:parvulin-like peptidyl-prolyl isomerase
MRNGDVTKTPIKIGDNWYIAGVTQRTDANMDDFAKERDDLMEQFLNRKRGEVFSDYMAATRRKLEADGDIKIYDDAIAKLDEESLPIGADQEQ